jgi:hypothetical protein
VTVYAFPDPRVIQHQRRCGRCGVLVLVYVMDNAFLPREPHYRCSECKDDVPGGVGRVLSLVAAEGQQTFGDAA